MKWESCINCKDQTPAGVQPCHICQSEKVMFQSSSAKRIEVNVPRQHTQAAQQSIVAYELHGPADHDGRESPEVRIVYTRKQSDEYAEEGWILYREFWSSKPTRSFVGEQTVRTSPSVTGIAQAALSDDLLQVRFERWAESHGGLDLTTDSMENEKLPFPATYWKYDTEIAWRAFANSPVTKAATAQVAVPEGFTINRAEGHGWYIDAPKGGRWVAHEGTPVADLITALAAAPSLAQPAPGADAAQGDALIQQASYQQGRAAGLEEAAKIADTTIEFDADNYGQVNASNTAEAIRALNKQEPTA